MGKQEIIVGSNDDHLKRGWMTQVLLVSPFFAAISTDRKVSAKKSSPTLSTKEIWIINPKVDFKDTNEWIILSKIVHTGPIWLEKFSFHSFQFLTEVEVDKTEIEMDKTRIEIDKTDIQMDKTGIETK